MPYFPPSSSGGAPTTATYITQTPDAGLSAEQAMSLLGTGLIKNTTTTGVQSIAVAGTDYAPPLTYTAGGADAAQAMAVNTIYVTDISGYTADRTYTLPGTAAVGDVCGIMLTVGDTAFELLITATAGDTLNGIAGGTEWSRLFIAGESVQMRCVVANTTWIVERDGRIPQKARLDITGSPDGETAATFTTPTAAATPGTWTAVYDVGSIASAAAGTFTVRRVGYYTVAATMTNKDNGTANNYVGVRILLNGGATAVDQSNISAALKAYALATKGLLAAVDDVYTYQYITQAGALGVATSLANYFTCVETLP